MKEYDARKYLEPCGECEENLALKNENYVYFYAKESLKVNADENKMIMLGEEGRLVHEVTIEGRQ